ncbi:bifunctional DNA primase/polymerase [Bifidobacterium cuniculi]|uniref:Transcriptional regulator, BlaI/MecI/CopY family n=1 Tax=Bifidobacterium cuniculi TaxID=1688 RepID=A0A087B3Y7_9BIFI|nr:bifunctional DNA primase/polymerase [Bifidobacterium cuniculi]KFI65737.1 transcriptional regulator, BlaI/MecI/CopY family [Bifidobacterium cuniculi]
MDSTIHGYAQAAPLYRAAGWAQAFPLPEGRKQPPPKGATGGSQQPITDQQMAAWAASNPDGNTGISMPDGILVIDIDSADGHNRKADGWEGIQQLVPDLGELPATWTSTAHGPEHPYAHRFYQVPTGLKWKGGAVEGVDLLRHAHRYAVVWPSIHPTGEQYRWYTPDGTEADHIPTPGELTALPDSWVAFLRQPDRPDRGRQLTPMPNGTPVTDDSMCPAVRGFLDKILREPAAKGSRHDTMTEAVWALIRFMEEGHRGVQEALSILHPIFVQSITPDRPGGQAEAEREWAAIGRGALNKNTCIQGAIDPCTQPPDDAITPQEIQEIEETATTGPKEVNTNMEPDRWANPPQQPTSEPTQARTMKPAVPSTWGRVNLADWADGNPNPAPSLLTRTDGISLLYRGRVNDLHGEPESGKSLLAQIATADLLAKHGRVAYIDLEDGPGGMIQRLRLLGVTDSIITDPDLFDYRNPTGRPDTQNNIADFTDLLDAAYDLIVFDGINNLMAGCGLDQDKAGDIAWLYQHLLNPCADSGAAVLTVDHVVKAKDAQGRFAAGSIQKLAQISGASYFVTPTKTIGRGIKGEITLRLAKDRNGYLSEHCAPANRNDRLREAARIEVDSTDRIRIRVTIGKPTMLPVAGEEPRKTKPTWVMERISRMLKTEGGWNSVNKIDKWLREDGKGVRHSTVMEALDLLLEGNFVRRQTGAKRANEYRYERLYSEMDDPESDNYQYRITDEELNDFLDQGDDDEPEF